MHFDLAVIGGGSGGIAAARRAASYGSKVVLFENTWLGGTCVNVGCVPKKVMYNASFVGEVLRDARSYGYDVDNRGLDFHTLRTKREAYIKRLNGIYGRNLAKDGITVVRGTARVASASSVISQPIEEGAEAVTYNAHKILIATGSTPTLPKTARGYARYTMTSDGFFELDSIPKNVAVVGSGYIAVEIAGILHGMGAKVNLVVRSGKLLSHFDSILGSSVAEHYKKIGINISFHTELAQITPTTGNKQNDDAYLNTYVSESEKARSTDTYTVEYTKKNEDGSVTQYQEENVDKIICAIGRHADVSKLGVDTINMKLNPDGSIMVNEYQETNVANVYAIGDVTGKAMLTPVAIAAGRRLCDRLFNNMEGRKLDYTNIPSVIFSHPPCGSIGISEEEARAAYSKVKVYNSKFINMYYSLMEPEEKQFTVYKIVCVGDNEKVVGLHLFGLASDEVLQGFGVAIKMGATKADFDECIAIHPTAAEELVTMR